VPAGAAHFIGGVGAAPAHHGKARQRLSYPAGRPHAGNQLRTAGYLVAVKRHRPSFNLYCGVAFRYHAIMMT
jgi:hypothetical protein